MTNGAILPGDRLPSTREAGADLGADPRVVAAAYRELSSIGLVTMSQRSGVFLSENALIGQERPAPPESWLTEALTAGIVNGYSIADLSKLFAAVTSRGRISAVVIAPTPDLAMGIARELSDDYGFDASYVLSETLQLDRPVPRQIRQADVLVCLKSLAELCAPLAARLKCKAVVVAMRTDAISAEWAMLLRKPVYLIGADDRVLTQLRTYISEFASAENLVTLVAGRDDLSKVPGDAPTYITEAARCVLGKTNLPGRLLKPPRLLDAESVKRLAAVVVAHNAGALRASESRGTLATSLRA